VEDLQKCLDGSEYNGSRVPEGAVWVVWLQYWPLVGY
jgi:hypothetical protein